METEDTIIGATITDIRPMTKDEMITDDWGDREIPICIVLSTGTIMFPSRDYEGNGTGVLFYTKPNGGQFAL